MIITVGAIDIEEKEAITNTGVHPNMGESLPAGNASLAISVPNLISYFNREEGIIIKNLPDGLLTAEQRRIKQRSRLSDIQKEAEKGFLSTIYVL